MPEGVTRLATLIAGEVHISDIDRALQKDATDKGMKIIPGKLTAIGHEWLFGGMYFATPEKLDSKQPFVDKRVRQAMNMAINRQAIATNILGGKAQPMLRDALQSARRTRPLWPGIWNPEWEKRAEDLYGYNPTKAKALLEEAGYKKGFEFTVYLYTCLDCRRSSISGRPWRSTGRRSGSSQSWWRSISPVCGSSTVPSRFTVRCGPCAAATVA